MNPSGSKKKRPDKRRYSVKKRTSDGCIVPYLKRLNENSEASSSTKRPRRGSPMNEIGNHLEKETPSNSEKTTDEEREFTVNLGDGGKEHVVKGKIHDSVLTALEASKDVCAHMDKTKGKIYLIGKKGIEGCINLGMPLKYMPDGSQFEMKSYKGKQTKISDKLEYRKKYNKGIECILFFVAPNANKFETNEPLSDKIIRCNQLLKEHSNLCVFAPEEETIKEAVCKDGRFMPFLNEKDWVLMENKKSIPNSHSVKTLSNRTFTIHVKTERRPKCTRGPNNEQVPLVSQETQLKTFHYFKHNLLNLYPDLKEQSKIINDFFEKAKQQSDQKKDVFGVYKAVFGKEKKNSVTVKMLKLHANLSESVGYIEWGINEKEGSATCFVLHGKHILTCHHVVQMIVGGGVEEKEWARKISQTARVTFSYEDNHPKENDWFFLEEWFEVSDVALDFAVLKLRESGPRGLLQSSFVPPFDGLIYIIGHPDGEAKSVDGCSVISVFERQEKCTQRLNQEKGAECNCVTCGYENKGVDCIHMYNPRGFPQNINNPDTITYDTSFFRGSSGSPVFDRNGYLVAMHAAGYLYKERNKEKSIIELGYSMKSILSLIEKSYKSWYDSEIAPVLRAGPDAGENAVGVDPPSTDVEMEPVDE